MPPVIGTSSNNTSNLTPTDIKKREVDNQNASSFMTSENIEIASSTGLAPTTSSQTGNVENTQTKFNQKDTSIFTEDKIKNIKNAIKSKFISLGKETLCYILQKNQIIDENSSIFDINDIDKLIENFHIEEMLSKIENGYEDHQGLRKNFAYWGIDYTEENVGRIIDNYQIIDTLFQYCTIYYNTMMDPSGFIVDNLDEVFVSAKDDFEKYAEEYAKLHNISELSENEIAKLKQDFMSEKGGESDYIRYISIQHMKKTVFNKCGYLSNEELTDSDIKDFQDAINKDYKAGVNNIDYKNENSINELQNILEEYFQSILDNSELNNAEKFAKINKIFIYLTQENNQNIEKIKSEKKCSDELKNAEALGEMLFKLSLKYGQEATKSVFNELPDNETKCKFLASIEKDDYKKYSFLFDFIWEQLQEGGCLSDQFTDLGIDSHQLFGIYNKFIAGGIESLKGDEKDILDKCFELVKTIYTATQAAIVSGNGAFLSGVGSFIGKNLGEGSYRDWLSGIHTWIGSYEGNLPENLQELLNQATNGNYQIIADGSNAPLNMNTEGSAYDQQTGGFTTNPEVNYDAQSALVEQLQQAMYNGTESNPLPKRVTENNNSTESKSSKSSVSYTKPSFIATYQQGVEYLENSANGVGDFLTGKIKSACKSFEIYVIEKYKSLVNKVEILANSISRFFSKLMSITKDSEVENYLAAGGKGNSVDRTKAMKEKVEKDKEKYSEVSC